MLFPKERGQPSFLEFEIDITNLENADAAHVERIIYRIIDDKKIDLEIIWKHGKSETPEKYTLTKD